MDVLFFVLDDDSRASSRLRVYNYIPFLVDREVSYETIPLFPFEQKVPGPAGVGYGVAILKLVLLAPFYDVVFLQKVPLPRPIVTYISSVSDLVYDFDDALYATPEWDHSTPFWQAFLDGTLSNATAVIAGNPELIKYAQDFTDGAVCIPTPLPKDKYRHRKQSAASDSEIVIGWVGNPENLWYLESIEDSLATVLDQNDDVSLHIITAESNERPIEPLVSHPDTVYRVWTLEKELDLLEEIDIGIRPLFDDTWTRGKGGYTSVVQMLALEIPVVVTPVGYLQEIVRDGENGFYATTDQEWIDECQYLVENPDSRQQLGREGRRTVEDLGFWTETTAERWIEAICTSGNR